MAAKPKKPTKKPAAHKPTKPVARKPTKKPAAAKATRLAAAKQYGKRSDLGASIDGYLARLDGQPRAIWDALVKLITTAAPVATSELKWGMPVFSINGAMVCYFRVQKAYIRFGLAPGAALDDPDRVLYGSGDGKHMKLTSTKDIDPKRMTGWVKAVASLNQ